MAIFRNIQMSFWTDPKIADDFAPDEKYFYLYLMTNPHTNLCGCYEVSMKQMSDETGYTKERVEKLIKRLEEGHRTIIYSRDSKEMLIVNWHKYNWTSSSKFRIPLGKEIQNVKNVNFKTYLTDLYNGIDTVSIPYPYPIDTNCIDTTDTDTITDTITDSITKNKYYPNDELLNKSFSDYVDYRKKIKKPMTDKAIELAIEKLNELSQGDNDKAIQIINQSIMQGWQGLFELKESTKGSGSNSKSLYDKWMNA